MLHFAQHDGANACHAAGIFKATLGACTSVSSNEDRSYSESAKKDEQDERRYWDEDDCRCFAST